MTTPSPATVHELRPPCRTCAAPSLAALCPMTGRMFVLRAELDTPVAKHRRWLCGPCLLADVTAAITQPSCRTANGSP